MLKTQAVETKKNNYEENIRKLLGRDAYENDIFKKAFGILKGKIDAMKIQRALRQDRQRKN